MTTQSSRSDPDPSLEFAVEAALEQLDLPSRVRLASGQTFWRLHAIPAAGLRQLVVSDGPVGVRGESWDERDVGLTLPNPTALAASWDDDLVARLAGLLAGECHRKGVDVLLAPTVNLHRSPLGGRHFECFSEDPLLTGRIGTAYVAGLQRGGIGACVKHYVANDSETDRMTVDVRVSDQALREVYLAPFEQIVTGARPWSVMASYNRVGGITMTESPLLAEPLKGEWGFDGVVMSDWHATRTTEAAGNGDLDLVMPGHLTPWADALLAAVVAGRVSEQAIQAKVRRLLRMAARVGALTGVEGGRNAVPGYEPSPAATPAVATPAVATPAAATPEVATPAPDAASVRDLARRAAAAGMVLARNQGLLPLRAGALRRVAVIGPNAQVARSQGGGSATVMPPHVVSPLQGLRAALGDRVEVLHAAGCHTRDGLVPVRADQVTDPVDQQPGVRVRYRDAAGRVVAQEHRLSGRLGWHGADLGVGAAGLEVEAVLQVTESGRWRVGYAGAGQFELWVAGAVVLAQPLEASVQDFEAFINPTQTWVEVELTAGAQVPLLLRHTPASVNEMVAVELMAEAPRLGEQAGLAQAAELAAAADVAVVVVGTTDLIESEGFDRHSLALPGAQDALVRAVVAANPRTVVVVNSGAPVLLPWRDEVPAVLLGWFGGQEFGAALAEVLLGEVEPGGRLPTTWPAAEADCPVLSTTPVDGVLAYTEGLDLGYRAWAAQVRAGGPAPAYWFGHGLGYTTWAYESIDVRSDGAGGATARVSVRNTGARAGRTVIQAYLSRPDSSVPRPTIWLAGYTAVAAEPGVEVVAEVSLPARAFQHWTGPAAGGSWAVEPGDFIVCCGASAAAVGGWPTGGEVSGARTTQKFHHPASAASRD